MNLPLEDEIALASHGLDVLVELHHAHVLRQVANEDSLHCLVLLALLSIALAALLASVDLEIATLGAKREGAEVVGGF